MEDITKELEAIKTMVESLSKVDEDRREHVLKYVVGALKIQNVQVAKEAKSDTQERSDFEDMTLSEFVQAKKPKNNYQLIATLGYYLENIKRVKEFGAKEIREANSEARLPPISNITRDIQNTQRQYNFIIPATKDKKKKTLSASGIELVVALPDQETAMKIMKKARPKLKKKGNKAKSNDEN